jgi:hypothetical protein
MSRVDPESSHTRRARLICQVSGVDPNDPMTTTGGTFRRRRTNLGVAGYQMLLLSSFWSHLSS